MAGVPARSTCCCDRCPDPTVCERPVHDYQRDFIELTLQREVLRFGDFTLKSGRHSPYFFNMGRIDSGAALAQLGRAYAAAVVNSGIEIDMLFGPPTRASRWPPPPRSRWPMATAAICRGPTTARRRRTTARAGCWSAPHSRAAC